MLADIKVNEKRKKVFAKLTTIKGEVIGFNSIQKPSTTFNPDGDYSMDILVDAEYGKEFQEFLTEIRKQQNKLFGKGTTLQDITRCVPYVYKKKNDEGEIIKEIPDTEGRYVIKAREKGLTRCKDGSTFARTVAVFDSKGKPILKDITLKTGSIVKLALELTGYTVAGKTGVKVQLKAVQVIEVVNTEGTADTYGFGEEEGFEVNNDEVSQNETTSKEKCEEEFDEEDLGF